MSTTNGAPPLRVVQWATGNVGIRSLRAIVDNPRFELVGALVYSDDKAGKDIGDVIGIGPVGVIATTSIDDILALDADCVAYNALGETNDPAQCLSDICKLLASGKNVVSTAVSTHIHPSALSDTDRERLQTACEEGSTTFHSTGINPGFAFDLLPLSLSVIADRIDSIHLLELVDMSEYTSESIVRDVIGMGIAPDVEVPLDYLTDIEFSPYRPCVQMIADAYGITFDRFDVTHEKAVTDQALELPWGGIDAGTVAAHRVEISGIANDQVRLTLSMIWRVSDDVAPHWPAGAAHYHVLIEGDPRLECRLDISSDTGRGTSAATALHAISAIPEVCAAPPGIATRLDLPVFAGGYMPADAND